MKINRHQIPAWLIIAAFIMVLGISLPGCKKDAPQMPNQNQNGNTINFVLNDNFTFSVVYGALANTGLQDSLAKPGPFTFLAPNNDAYSLLNIPANISATSFQFYSNSRLKNEMRYYTIDGKIAFKSIPLVDNKPYKTHTGGNVYVSRYLDGKDTVTAVNGVKLLSLDNAASNGLIQVLPQPLNPEVYPDALSYLHSDTTLSLFSAALQRAGLDQSLLQGSDVYTLLAPSNTAFQQSAKLGKNLGISTLDSITKADPVKLAAFLNYHIIKGRYFDGDLFRYAKTNPAGIATLNSGKIIIGGSATGFHTITFLGNGDKGVASAIAAPVQYSPIVHNANIPCGNAVVHIINRVLIP